MGWKLEKCSCMLQYGWYFDNSKDFGGVKLKKRPFMLQYGWYVDNSNEEKNEVFHEMGGKKWTWNGGIF